METVHVSTDSLKDVYRTTLIRQWWYTYCRLLRGERHVQRELNQLTAECEAKGIVRPNRPMPKDGAEDLASQAKELKRQREKRTR